MRKRIISIGLVLALISVLITASQTSAANTVGQNATTNNVSAIAIRSQNYSSDVTTIIFPPGSPGSTVSNPYNNVDTSSSPQRYGGAGDAYPAVTLVNTDTSYEYIIYINIGTWSNNVVSSEYFLVNDYRVACSDASAISTQITFGTNTNTSKTITPSVDPNGSRKDLYLKSVLSNVGGLTGSSTITIISERT
jgi:hypothetical protein